MFYTEEAPQSEVAVLFSTPKKFHKRANKRNVLRRRMREAYRLNNEELHSSLGNRRLEFAIVYSSKTVHDYKTIENGVKRVLQHILESL
jgi:ribonuclease P protein component